MNLFGRKAAPPVRTGPVATADTIRKIREQLDTLEKREQHIEKKIIAQLEEAKQKSAKKDKRGAIFALKRKKMYEAEIEKLQVSSFHYTYIYIYKYICLYCVCV
jgi:charged multivesicular body protein 4